MIIPWGNLTVIYSIPAGDITGGTSKRDTPGTKPQRASI